MAIALMLSVCLHQQAGAIPARHREVLLSPLPLSVLAQTRGCQLAVCDRPLEPHLMATSKTRQQLQDVTIVTMC